MGACKITSSVVFLLMAGMSLFISSAIAEEDKSYKIHEARYDKDYLDCFYRASDEFLPIQPDAVDYLEKTKAKDNFLVTCMESKGYRDRNVSRADELSAVEEVDFDKLKSQRTAPEGMGSGAVVGNSSEIDDNKN